MSDPSRESPSGSNRAGIPPRTPEAVRELLTAHADSEMRCVELCPICRAADLLRAGAPDDLRDQWQAIQREGLLTLKALVDYYVERLETDQAEPDTRVEDIPIA